MVLPLINKALFKSKKVLLRVDFNVPLTPEGTISDDTRLQAVIPTIKYIIDQKASLIIISHLGRPKGHYDKKLSLKGCAERLSKLLNKEVLFSEDCIGEKAHQKKQALKPQQILLLENLRFHASEADKNRSLNFATQLADGCDIYVNDAFGCCHRSDASIVDLPKLFEGQSYMGFLLEKEIEAFQEKLKVPKQGFVAIIGGAKISTKIGVMKSLLTRVDTMLVGGAMAYTFLSALGCDVANSLIEPDFKKTALSIIQECKEKQVDLVLPKDIVFALNTEVNKASKIIDVGQDVPEQLEGVDIGPKTVAFFREKLQHAKAVFWNGPLGVFENPAFAMGTFEVAKALSVLNATTVIGGGDSIAAVKKLGLEKKFDHLSTGGGASLEFLEKGSLPGIEALGLKK